MANLRALGDIQRRGLEAANLVIGRLIGQVGDGGPLFGAEPPTGAGDRHPPGAPDLAAMTASYAALMSSFLGALGGAGGARSVERGFGTATVRRVGRSAPAPSDPAGRAGRG